MKYKTMKTIAALVLGLFLLSSCYINTYTREMVTITDLDATANKDVHTIQITMPSSYKFITYTTDGLIPDASSTKYTDTISVNVGVTIKAAAFRTNSKKGYLRSIISEYTVKGE